MIARLALSLTLAAGAALATVAPAQAAMTTPPSTCSRPAPLCPVRITVPAKLTHRPIAPRLPRNHR